MKSYIFISCLLISAQISCQNNKTHSSSGENEVNKMKTTSVENAGAAKRPSGIISYYVNGVKFETQKEQNQCMIVGMGNDYGQLTVSGGNQLTIIYVGKPALGEIKIHKVANIPDLGIQLMHGGDIYSNMQSSDTKVEITQMKKDGNNYYISGKFSGTLKTNDGKKSLSLTNGVFESAYAN